MRKVSQPLVLEAGWPHTRDMTTTGHAAADPREALLLKHASASLGTIHTTTKNLRRSS